MADDNQSLHSWREVLGSQIRQARKGARLTQGALGHAVGKSRNMIVRYEAGSDAPTVEVLGKIALELAMSEFNVNGYRFSVRPHLDASTGPSAEQLGLDFDKEYVYPGATIKITPSRVTITITAIAPMPTSRSAA